MSNFKSDRQRKYVMAQLNKNQSSHKKYELKNQYPNLKVNWEPKYTGYPIFDSSIKNPDNPHRRFNFEKVSMTPEEYMQYQYKIFETRQKVTDGREAFWTATFPQHVNKIKKEIIAGKTFHPFVIEFKEDGTLYDFQEGRHTIVAMDELGVKKVPVYKMYHR